MEEVVGEVIEPLRMEHVWDCGSCFMSSSIVLRMSWPVDAADKLALLSVLLIIHALLPSLPFSDLTEEVQLYASSVPGSCLTRTCSTEEPPAALPDELQLPLLPVLEVLEGRAGVWALDTPDDPGECVDSPGDVLMSTGPRCVLALM